MNSGTGGVTTYTIVGTWCTRKGVWCQSGVCSKCSLPDIYSYHPFYSYYPIYSYSTATPKKRIIEKFDDKGNLIERITEDI